MNKNGITLYGADWCADCKQSRSLLDSRGVAYEYVDIDVVAGATDTVANLNGGFKSIPTIVFPDGSVLVEPSNTELANKLDKVGI